MDKVEWLDKLKKAFTASPRFEGYDPDEDPGYFLEFVLDRLYEARNLVDLWKNEVDTRWIMDELKRLSESWGDG
jgi:hypothetical protein